MLFYELNELERRQSPTNRKIEAGAVPRGVYKVRYRHQSGYREQAAVQAEFLVYDC